MCVCVCVCVICFVFFYYQNGSDNTSLPASTSTSTNDTHCSNVTHGLTSKKEKFFILTSNEAIATKTMAEQRKNDKGKKQKPKTAKKERQEAKQKGTSKRTSKDQDYFCACCGEQYQDPPIEDWIACHGCGEWCHEACTTEGSCDICN